MTRKDFARLAATGIILDGATGTELAKLGMPAGIAPELWLLENPQAILQVHQAYRDAGSQILYAPTFGANRCKLAEFGAADQLEKIITTLMKTVKAAAGNSLIFGDIAPTGCFVEPAGDLPFEEAVAIYREAAAIMAANGADGFAVETMMDLQEARAALTGCREAAPDLPVIVTMTFEAGGRSLTGTDPVSALITLQSLGADAFGCNCSTGPEDMARIITALKPYAQIPLVAKPNAGLPRLRDGKTVFDMEPESFGEKIRLLIDAGASILGGCCGTTPRHIAALARTMNTTPLPRFDRPPVKGMAASATAFRHIAPGESFTLIGERINPTGKKALQAELKAGRTDMVFDFAVQQSAAGAAILDVNMGMAGIDEKEMMLKSLKRILKSSSPMLCIDSTDSATVEAALRLYPGRALLNSISAEKWRLEKILPIAAKYGAMLIILPLTDEGIPATAAERMAVVDTIIAECAKYGYDTADLCIDALILAVSTRSDAAANALEFISMCTRRGLNTVCGLSNISFGLPERQLLNRTFLGMAMGCGLNMAIANPLFPEITDAIAAGDILAGHRDGMKKFLDRFAAMPASAVPRSDTAALSPRERLFGAILDGNRESLPQIIDSLLPAMEPGNIINEILIPAITAVGEKYEKKEFFLPQLIAGAEAMQCATAILEPLMLQKKTSAAAKTRVIIATVKGDIHDIGKNIVAVILRNYDFDVIDLGKDVPAETILETAKSNGVKVILLSALMTTTMSSMKEVIELARARGLDDLHFVVGGAVVDETFAQEVGAHYGATPMDSMRLAKKLAGLPV